MIYIRTLGPRYHAKGGEEPAGPIMPGQGETTKARQDTALLSLAT